MRILFEPLALGLLLAVTGALLASRWRWLGRCVAGAGILGLYAASTGALGGMWVRGQEEAVQDECNALRTRPGVVLMGGVMARAGSPADWPLLGTRSLRRITEAVALAQRHGAPTLVISGGGEHAGVPEAVLGASLARQMGWPAARLEVESASTNTRNAPAALQAQSPSLREVVLVSSALHLPRAAAAFRAAGFAVHTCPVDRSHLPYYTTPAGWVPQLGVLQRVTEAWYEFWAARLAR